jgi:tetratricopeptide (TPR) repeat protein
MRRKTQQRLTILAAGFVLIMGTTTALYLHFRALRKAEIADRRVAALKEFHDGNYDQAQADLTWYAYRVDRDPEAYYALAVSCAKLSQNNGDFIPRAIQVFRRYVDMVDVNHADAPTRIQYDDAQHQLMDLFVREAGGDSEAIRLADQIIADNPNDLDALSALAWVNARDPQHYKDALAASLKYNQVKPSNLDLEALTMRLMAQLKYPTDALIKHADDLKKQFPDDPRFDLVEVMAHFQAAQYPDAPVDQRVANATSGQKSLAATTQADPPDAQFVEHLVFYLDHHNDFSESLAALAKAAAKLNDPDIEQIFIQRLWQNQKYAEVVERTKSLDPAKADPQIVALRALSLMETQQNAQAAPLVDALDKRSSSEAVAHAWTIALRARLAAATTTPRDLLEQYQQALSFDPNITIIRYLVGDTYSALGEQDMAMQQWKLAARQDPSWALPHMRIALLAEGSGQVDQAAETQAIASNLADTNLRTLVTALYAKFDHARATNDPDELKAVLTKVQEIQTRFPNEPQTLPLYVSLLCKTSPPDRDKALNIIDGVLRTPPAGGQDVMLKLVQVSLAQQLGREDDLLAAAQNTFGSTPALAMARAGVMLAANHTPAEVLDLVRHMADDALSTTRPSGISPATMPSKTATRADWDLVIAQIMDLTRSTGAADNWTTLGDANPSSLTIQDAILQSATAWSNRPFMERTVQRVHNLTTDDSLNWQIGNARLMLSGDDRKQQSADVIHILRHVIDVAPDQIEPRLLMASALEIADNPQGAIDELKTANTISPNSADILYGLVRLEYAGGHADEARQFATNLASLAKVTPELLRNTASMLADQGDYALSQAVLEKAGGDATDPRREALVAYLDWHQGQISDASTIFFKLLAAAPTDPNIVRQTADFFASQRDMGHARQALAQLDSLSLPPGQKEQYVGAFDEQVLDDTGAAAAFDAAVKAAPSDPSTWVAAIGYRIRHGQLDQARSLLAQGLAANPGQPKLTALGDLCQKMTGLTMTPDTLALVTALTQNPTDAAARDTLDALIDAASKNQAPRQLTLQLTALADKYPQFLPVYVLAVQHLLHDGSEDQALNLAQRAANLLPNSARAAQMLTDVYGFAGDWADMKQAAQVWRRRSQDNPMEPDIALAISDLATGQGADALAILKPYVNPDAADGANVELTTTYARALIGVGREDDAAAFLTPLAKASPQWRSTWMQLGVLTHGDAAGAIAWVQRVVPMIPADSVTEQCALADTWYDIGVHHNDPDAFAKAQAVLNPLAGRSDLPPDSLMTLASSMEQAGDKVHAEAMYRKVLQANPQMAPAQNNLAYLLLMKNDPAVLPEAETLAKSAVASAPQNPQTGPYYDTLARVYLKESQTAPAEAAFTQAAALQPWNVDVLLGLGDARIKLNRLDKAGEALAQIDALVRNRTVTLSPDQQRQVDTLRDQCKNINRNPVTGTN